MSADRLREAARVLRERAEAATPGPWSAFRADGTWVGVTNDMSPTEESKAGDVWADERASKEDATFAATMHPGVALALADWLDYRAGFCEAEVWPDTHETNAVADLILGGAS